MEKQCSIMLPSMQPQSFSLPRMVNQASWHKASESEAVEFSQTVALETMPLRAPLVASRRGLPIPILAVEEHHDHDPGRGYLAGW